jgi:hypothetical protein
LPKVRNVFGLQSGFFEEFGNYLFLWSYPWLNETTDAVPHAAVIANQPAPSEKRDLSSPFDNGCDDDPLRRDFSAYAILGGGIRGSSDDAHLISLKHAQPVPTFPSRTAFAVSSAVRTGSP